MSIDLTERTIQTSKSIEYANIPAAELLDRGNTDEDDTSSVELDRRFRESCELPPESFYAEDVPRHLGGFALADEVVVIVEDDGSTREEVRTNRQTLAYERSLTPEEAERYSCRKKENAEPGVKPQGRLGEINFRPERRTRSE